MNAASPLAVAAAKPPPETYRLQDQVGFILRKAHQRHLAIFSGHY